MSSPSFENIDKWIFDYLEGNLSSKQKRELEQFLSDNPELDVDFHAWKESYVEQEEQVPVFQLNLVKPYPYAQVILSSSVVVLAVFAIIFSYLQFNHLFLDSRYLAENIDVSKISIAEDFDDWSITKIADQTPVFSDNSDKIMSTEKELSLKDNNQIVPLSNDFNSRNYIAESNNQRLENDSYMVNEGNLSALVSTINNFRLAQIEASDNEGEIVTIESEETILKANQNNITMRKRFQAGVKQAKRMLDQPVALSNSRDPNIHVPMMTGYQANFGMAGSTLRTRFQNTTRSQWHGSENAKIQNLLSYDSYIYALRGGLGLDLAYSNYGDGSIQDFVSSITYSPKFSLSKNVSFEPAVRFKMGNVELDQSSQFIGSRIERTRGNVRDFYTDNQDPLGSSMWYRDLGVGALINTKWFYTGVNVDNVRRHYNNIYSSEINDDFREDLYFTALAGTEYKPFGKEIQYNVYAFYQKYGALNEIWTGGGVQWRALDMGVSANQNMDFVASLGIKTADWSVHYNLDYLESRLLNQKMLSHQVSLRVMMRPSRYVAKFLS